MTVVLKKAVLPLGFRANGVSASIKKSHKLDLALFYSISPAKASCQFTSNKILAAPIVICKKHLKNHKEFQAIIVNSGNANCFTGTQGIKDAADMAGVTARALGIDKGKILVASTGVIAKRLPIDKIKKSVSGLAKGLTKAGIAQAKKAIMTTDTFSKEITVKFNIGNKPVNICGVAKGSGMIAPNMATMLCFIFTDANIAKNALDKALEISLAGSFNCITVDGCMSTNDTVMSLANGMAGNELINTGYNFSAFTKALKVVCLELAKMIVRDGEGATKFIQIKVAGAKSCKEAKSVALSIANSNLFKTAIFASSANCLGRIVAAVGASGVDIKEKDLKISHSLLSKKEVDFQILLGRGKSEATIYTSDLSYEYVKINAEYN